MMSEEQYKKQNEKLEKILKEYEKIKKQNVELKKQLADQAINESINHDEIKDEIVKKVENGKKQAKKGNKFVAAIGITALAALIALGSYNVYLFYKEKKVEKNKKNKTNIEQHEMIEPTLTITIGDKINNNTNEESTIMENNNNEVVQETNYNSDEFIRSVANKAWNRIQEVKQNDSSFAKTMDETYIYELVKYIHHNEEDYNGTYNITNENAYGNFNELSKNTNFNLGILFEGLDYAPYITELNDAFNHISNNKDYADEYQAYQSLGKALDNVNTSKYPESIATMALIDNFIDLPSMQLMHDGVEEYTAEWTSKYNQPNEYYGDEYYNEKNSIDQNKRYECKTVYQNVDRNNSNYMFNIVINNALEEDKHIAEYNANAQVNNEIDYNYVDDNYETIAENFYNSILRYRNTYGDAFANAITSKNDVIEIIYFINEFKDPNIKSTINSKEVFESLINSYYNSCAIYGVEPNMSILFSNYQYGQSKLSEAEKLAANLKNGKNNDYTISNEYYKWYITNLSNISGDINLSLKENAPLVDILIEQFKNYRMVGNMLAARQNQKTFDLGIGSDGQFVCPDSVDDYIINQTPIEGGHVVGDVAPFQTVYDYINAECQGRSR